MEDVEGGVSNDASEVIPTPRKRSFPLMIFCTGVVSVFIGAAIGVLATLGANGQLKSDGNSGYHQTASRVEIPDKPKASLPSLPTGAVSFFDVHKHIKTDRVVNHTWEVKFRDCPNNNFNQPCATPEAPGPILHGVRSSVITINDLTPGPKIEANLGDTIRVTVNNLMNAGMTVHFHGLTQFSTPWMDGTPLVNCEIPPSGTFTYEFIAHPAGSAFYHSHTMTQHEAGLSGAIVIHDPSDPHAEKIDGADHVAIFKDWWSKPAEQLYYFWQQNSIGGCLTFANENLMGGFNPARYYSNELDRPTFWSVMGDALLFESLLVNGKGVYNWSATQVTIKTHGLTAHGQLCPGQIDPPKCQWCYEPGVGTKQCDNSSADLLCGDAEVFEVELGKTSRIRLISDAQLYMLQVCIDHHNFTVLATDMMPIEPFQTKCMIIAPGERYDIAVLADQQPGDYMIRFITLEHGAYLESLPFIENCKLQAKGPCSLTATPDHTWGLPSPGFPHQGFAILRYKGAAPSMPMPPDAPDYWLSAVTLGCSSDPTRKDPRRCHHIRELKSIPETLSSYYPKSARGTDFKQPSELKPTVQFTTQISFLPDEVPRIENKALLSRMQVYDNATYGFPYIWSNNASDWHEDTPVAFVFPKEPTLSLDDDERNAVYNYRKVWREPNRSNAGEWYPNFPKGWSRISSGTQTVSVKYGEVVRIFMNATIPFGAGPAMPHPMHIHGHKVAILGIGRWNEPFDESKLNTTHPVYKDVVPLYTDSWMVIQFVAGNPGIWPFHCHVNIHFNSGMGIAIDSGAELSDFRKTPSGANNCPMTR